VGEVIIRKSKRFLCPIQARFGRNDGDGEWQTQSIFLRESLHVHHVDVLRMLSIACSGIIPMRKEPQKKKKRKEKT
jgi:hypothetical protein